MIRALLPAGAAGADAFGDAPEGALLPAEEAVVAGVAPGRRREFATVRHCARRALRELAGRSPGPAPPPVALLPDRDGVPRWPDGLVGSMTHTRGYRAAVVARAADVARLGIDAEPDRPLRPGVLETIASPAERAALPGLIAHGPGGEDPGACGTDAYGFGGDGFGGGGGVCGDRLLFCAKEAAYKAWFPHARVLIGFRDVEVDFGGPASGGRFEARVRRAPGVLLRGRWGAGNGLLVAVVATPADGARGADPGH
ncbi:4'-phosphopantetheinyl transferase [Streptomyces sp. NPDC058674]|uniref:4'-phosphopantetheinyl transferase family protein n=1 Tax=Streptomyces sp. NPDC058674 TaxID=3346592 RepID=UPI0036495F6C